MTLEKIIESVDMNKVMADYKDYFAGGAEVSIKKHENIFYEKRSIEIHIKQIASSDGGLFFKTFIKMGANKFRNLYCSKP